MCGGGGDFDGCVAEVNVGCVGLTQNRNFLITYLRQERLLLPTCRGCKAKFGKPTLKRKQNFIQTGSLYQERLLGRTNRRNTG